MRRSWLLAAAFCAACSSNEEARQQPSQVLPEWTPVSIGGVAEYADVARGVNPLPGGPRLLLHAPLTGSVHEEAIPFAGRVDAPAGLVSLRLLVDDQAPIALEVGADGSFSGAVELPPGGHELRFEAVDRIGRLAAATVAAQVKSDEPWRDFEPGEDRPGGTTTVDEAGSLAFSRPLANLPASRLAAFSVGDNFFDAPWFEAPSASFADRDGLGPLFHADSCLACHVGNGRGLAPAEGDAPVSLLFRLSLPDGSPHPVYGDQLQPEGISGVAGEGRVRVRYERVTGTYGDGTPWELRRPSYEIYRTNYGELGEVLVSPRIAQQMIGLGLLQAVSEETILEAADPDDVDGDGISGRPNRVTRIRDGAVVLGRFGWKANQPDLNQQNASALLGDLGITSPLRPGENCGGIPDCDSIPNGGEPEINAQRTEALDFYTATLAPPARREPTDPEVLAGKALFHELGCASCHRPSMVTAEDADPPELAGQVIWPYTDLLLHDMGEGLADARPDGEADGREWRTAPLWGIGLTEVVSGTPHFLHDGRARTIEEAILWHGGEAEDAKEGFRNLPASDRQALVRFVKSL